MNVVSVITPVYQPVREQLLATYESLRGQELPAGWAWEWVLQEDGDTGIACQYIPEAPGVSHGANRHLGVSLTRNLALSRATGSLIKNLDQDDVLTPGVLARDIETLSLRPHVGWTTSRVLDLLPDGSTVGFDNDPPAGELERGTVFEHWRSHNYRLPVHPTTMCIRRTLVVALGGWMAVPGSDDTGLLVAASVTSTGYFHSEVGLLYRKWPGQVTAGAAHTEPVEWRLRMNLIEERATALGALWPASVVA
jgi:glycosyltransferase involved in cell wall biosynthesis